ncbi:Heat shock protein DnaJ [Macrophomina phaseolina MS6]|uniref:Heat shock protein DnaJ n=1 Tax=Macrophomina phaseolina (strain MS6) TaxID=1126212 RepID=K2RRE5_MACPH|nr:Heat shock protein DnaJ [Macrophomina phaseolina MS6]
MGSPLPPDPYAALGVAKDATAAAIKTAYRKLALKSHPDKFPDPAQKAEKAAEFHKIQQAYEILGDDDKRERYNAQVRLAELRREHMERQQARGAATKTAEARPAAAPNYDIRTPSGTTTYASPRASRPYEESRSRPAYDEDDYEPQAKPRSTKYVYSRPRAASPPRVSRGVKIFFGGGSSHARSKARDQEKKRERVEKFVPVNNDSDSEERYRYDEMKRRAKLQAQRQEMEEEDRRRREEDDFRRRAEADRRRDEEMAREREASRRSSSRRPDRDSYKYLDQEQAAREHMSRNRGASTAAEDREPVRPAATSRTSSKYAQVRPKKESSKRSSEKSKDRILAGVKYGRGTREKERKSARANESEYEEERRRPTLEKADSSPANVRTAQRSATIDPYPTREREEAQAAHPRIRRADTMPAPSPSKSSQREEAKANTSKIRTEIPKHVQHDSGYSSPSTSSSEKERESKNAASSRKTTTTQYRYGADGGVAVGNDDVYHTVTVEPPSSSGTDSRKTASRSPLRERGREREDDDSGRTAHPPPNPTRYTYPAETETRRPHVSRTVSSRNVPPAVSRSPQRERDRGYDRGRTYVVSPDRARGYSHNRDYERPRGSNTFFGEIPKQAGEPLRRGDVPPVVRPTMRRGESYSKNDVNWARKYSAADISYAPRSRERSATNGVKQAYAFPNVDLGKPPLQRNHTMAY